MRLHVLYLQRTWFSTCRVSWKSLQFMMNLSTIFVLFWLDVMTELSQVHLNCLWISSLASDQYIRHLPYSGWCRLSQLANSWKILNYQKKHINNSGTQTASWVKRCSLSISYRLKSPDVRRPIYDATCLSSLASWRWPHRQAALGMSSTCRCCTSETGWTMERWRSSICVVKPRQKCMLYIYT